MGGSGWVRLWALGGALLWHVVQARLVQRWLVFAAGVGRGKSPFTGTSETGAGAGAGWDVFPGHVRCRV